VYHLITDFFPKGYPDNYKVEPKPTGVAMETLKHIGNVVSSSPPGEFTVHSGMFNYWGTLI